MEKTRGLIRGLVFQKYCSVDTTGQTEITKLNFIINLVLKTIEELEKEKGEEDELINQFR